MGKVTNELLMAFVDGELEPEMRERVEAALRADPELRERAAMFEATRQPIAKAFDLILRYPSSVHAARLRARATEKTHAPDHEHREPARFFSPLSSKFAPATALPMAAALSAVFLAGLGVGWLTKSSLAPNGGSDAALFDFRNDGLVAQGGLQRTLEKIASGTSIPGDVAGGERFTIKPVLTFRDHRTRYCREYELTFAAAHRYGGVACREDGAEWDVLVHTRIAAPPASRNGPTIASGEGLEVLDAAVDRMIEGDALQPAREAALLKSGWRREDQ